MRYVSTSYVELHARSAFSFLRGASQPERMAEQAARLGLQAMALCDRDGFYGIPRFHGRARAAGLEALVGCELSMEDGSVLPLLVASRQGYQNLCRLLSSIKLNAPKGEGSCSWDLLAMHAAGLIALTGDHEGPLYRAWQSPDSRPAAHRCLERLDQVFGHAQVYLEIQRHHLRGQRPWERFLCDLADWSGRPLLATNGVSYATPEERRIHDVFSCLRHHCTLDEAGRLLEANHERYLKSPAQMQALFADRPDALKNTLALAERLEFQLSDLGYEFPSFPVPEGESMDSFLSTQVQTGARERYGKRASDPAVRRQLETELKLISKLGFSGYFLVVWDIIQFCRRKDILAQGRGSAANSAVCYVLGITAVDPIGSGLLFERFLSEGRQGWPDIDIDLPSGDRREQVIQEVYRRYGRRGAAMTANVITYRGRSASREVGKVLGLSEIQTQRFASLLSRSDCRDPEHLQQQLKQAGIDREHPRARSFLTLYQQIRDLPRHLGQHSGGMVICQGALDSVVPIENASMPGRSVVQWDKDDCEDLGIIKVDLLGLGMMAVMQDAIRLSHERGHPVDLAQIPKDDKASYDLMCAADTIGVFQIESRAQMATLPRMRPRCFYDLVIEIAIIRPGPIQGNMLHPYLERRSGHQSIDYIDDRLKPILERTLGVPLFQEQMLRIAMVMADFNGSEAEELRRALNFTRSEERLLKVSAKLRQAMERKGIEEEKIERIIQALGSFALYGFPESHAASFALLAYASTYLKVHYPAEFYCSLLNNQPMGFYRPATLIQDARRRGLRFRPVCIQASEWNCSILDDQTIRLGFRMVKGLQARKLHSLLVERQRQPFQSTTDFIQRSGLSTDDRRRLASIGALNTLAGDRRSALWKIERSYEQGELFANAVAESEELSPLEMMTQIERLQTDYQHMTLTTGRHPMATIRDQLNPLGIVPAAGLPDCRPNSLVKVAGSVICRQRPGTAKGFVFISLEDETGVSNTIVRPQLFETQRLTILQASTMLITGTLQHFDNTISIKATDIQSLSSQIPHGGSYDFH
ncbi:MAG: error-prone DNA polymerase [Opitutales bacterium]|nr:error-prone DNA polymerase [Opitutales bacterium]